MPKSDSGNVFHDHLDVCKWCRSRPFDLCPLGAQKLQEAVANLEVPLLERKTKP